METVKDVREFVKLMAVWHPKGYSGTSMKGEWVVLDPPGGKGYHSASQEIIVKMICRARGIPWSLEPGVLRNLLLILILGGIAATLSGAYLLIVLKVNPVFLAVTAIAAGCIGGYWSHLDTRGGKG